MLVPHEPSAPDSRPSRRTRRWGGVLAAVAACALVGGVGAARATSPEGAAAYVPVSPCRLADTRPAPFNVGGRSTPLGPDETMTLTGRGARGECTGASALPAEAVGLQLNVTALNASQATFLTLYPSGSQAPNASHLNPVPGQPPAPNAVAVRLDAVGRFEVFNKFGAVDVIVDVVGFYTDHHHDDRYFTRQQSDARYYQRTEADARYYTRAEVDALTDRPWRVDIGVGELIIQSSTTTIIWNGILSGTATTTYLLSFRLPDDYRAGRDVLVETMYRVYAGADEEPCDVHLTVWDASRFRDGVGLPSVPVTFVDPAPSGGLPANETLLHVDHGPGGKTATFRLSGTDLAPGDWVRVRAGRQGASAPDTCVSNEIVGITVTEG